MAETHQSCDLHGLSTLLILCSFVDFCVGILYILLVILSYILGILSHRWQILFKMIVAEPAKVVNLVKAMCVLHNLLRTHNDINYTPPGFADSPNEDGTVTPGFWRSIDQVQLADGNQSSRSTCLEANNVRSKLVNYFSSEHGAVEWQNAHINRR